MKVLEGIQALSTQSLTTQFSNGETVVITLDYKLAVQMWYINIEFGDFIVNGLRVCSSPNLLQQFEKIIPFGLNVNVIDNTEPFLINDFSTGRVLLGVLTPEEVQQINEAYEGAKI